MEIFSAAAHRFADIHNMHLVADRSNAGHWIAVRLSDGGSDGVLYDYRHEAVTHQLHESLCAYVQIQRMGMTPREAESVLKFYRFAYDNGRRVTDPETPAFILPLSTEDMKNQLRRLRNRS